MSITLIAVIIFIGLVLVVLEIFVIPGTTVFGLLGAAAVISGIIMAYTNVGLAAGNITLALSSIASVILVLLGFRMVKSKRISVNEAITSKVNVLEKDLAKAGDPGVAFTTIRPNGKAIINDRKLEVYSIGEYIEKDAPIEVVKVTSSKIYVKPKNVS